MAEGRALGDTSRPGRPGGGLRATGVAASLRTVLVGWSPGRGEEGRGQSVKKRLKNRWGKAHRQNLPNEANSRGGKKIRGGGVRNEKGLRMAG